MLNSNILSQNNVLNINSITNEEYENDDDTDEVNDKNNKITDNLIINSRTNLINKSIGSRLAKSKKFDSFLYIVDVFLSVFIFSPIIGVYW